MFLHLIWLSVCEVSQIQFSKHTPWDMASLHLYKTSTFLALKILLCTNYCENKWFLESRTSIFNMKTKIHFILGTLFLRGNDIIVTYCIFTIYLYIYMSLFGWYSTKYIPWEVTGAKHINIILTWFFFLWPN